MNYRNLTPHAVRIRIEAGDNRPEPLESDIVLAPEPLPLRIAEREGEMWMLDGGIPLIETRLGEIENLPAPQEGVLLVVSMPVAERAYQLGRRDVVSPDSGKTAIRFKLPNGNEGIYAVRRLRFIVS
jgi:hypothetical protein